MLFIFESFFPKFGVPWNGLESQVHVKKMEKGSSNDKMGKLNAVVMTTQTSLLSCGKQVFDAMVCKQ